MKKRIISVVCFIIVFFAVKGKAFLHYPPSTIISTTELGLFDSDTILDISLKGNIIELLKNRIGDAKYFPIILTYKNETGVDVSIPISVKTRGHFRREKGNCTYPPLLLKFSGNEENHSSYFPEKSALKLVMPCRGEEFIVHEWLVYKLYNLVTPQSFRAKLVRVNLVDEHNKKMDSPFYGIILEEESQMAKRNNDVVINKKMQPQKTMREPFLKMAVFEYMIGNTDWSVQYLQNVKLIARDSNAVPITVPYDFDLSGIVNSPYAMPAEELKMSSVRQRRYRGFCIKDITLFDSTIAFYNRLKPEIYKTYSACSLLDAKYIKKTLKFLDEFYATINNPKLFKKEFQYPCDPNGTGNVIIKGLRED